MKAKLNWEQCHIDNNHEGTDAEGTYAVISITDENSYLKLQTPAALYQDDSTPQLLQEIVSRINAQEEEK